MNLLDLAVVGALLLAGLVGLRTGLLQPGLAWFGVAPGLLGAIRLLPWALEEIGPATERWHPMAYPLGVSAGVLVAGALVGHIAGYWLGRLLHLALPESLRTADRVAGFIAVAAVAGALAWLLAPTAASTPGWLSEASEGSLLMRTSLELLPPPPEGLDRVVAWVRLDSG
ncbi:MAG: CvpA family protein [bacterium]|nr:CvpA family protein [bacterium]